VSRYNQLLQTHFSSCLLLATARDKHRNRDVQLRMLPGEFEYVGVTDGTDSWIAPVAGDPFSVHIKRILDNVRQGSMPQQRSEAPFLSEDVVSPASTQTPRARRRIELPPPNPVLILRRR
jgi:hypothetical protein